MDLITVRRADLAGPDREQVRLLVEAYLRQTELEKAEQQGEAPADDALPERYRAEIHDPATAYDNAVVHVAEADGELVGIVVVQRSGATREIKRLWVDPRARGRRVGSALLDAAISLRDLPVRLTVWEWRDDAMQLYRARGFAVMESWDERPRLVCMQLEPDPTLDCDG
ncbi:Ribosomal protein S18 acetylase RimI [Agreia bicolorata]|uniref:Ribosomal protein S18 acetylase RimI n=1 Tax=Agreia bicolorata TaxID=110935 RepID=A0A1T4Y574_9MICO|nr:GNAT family N-acetyltransferase [Agreia bicolorata]SKA96445.1 Ribosomal protein S18 acetylase RimI [Agreia bicolorata]